MSIKYNIQKQIVILVVSLFIAFLVSKYLEVSATGMIMTLYTKFTGKIVRIIDSSGIPLVNYGYVGGTYIGAQRNPITISDEALTYYDKYKGSNDDVYFKELLINNANWLVYNAVSHSNYSILEYKFPWPNYDLEPPWRSGMAQGRALDVLTKAHEITGQNKYLDSAKMLLNSFFVEVKDGGVTYKTPKDGWWYELYAGNGGKEPRVLNGMMFTLLGIYKYYEYTHDNNAKYLFDQGVLALKKNLPHYEYYKGSYSTYDVLDNRKPAAPNYHKIHVEYLGLLYNITKEQIFKEYHDKWENSKAS